MPMDVSSANLYTHHSNLLFFQRLMHFSLDCEMPTRNAGISVSLLSVCLATLMALFRDRELAVRVSKEHLVQLIQETGTALLDPRLVVSSENSLDEATSSQVVRAINKVSQKSIIFFISLIDCSCSRFSHHNHRITACCTSCHWRSSGSIL